MILPFTASLHLFSVGHSFLPKTPTHAEIGVTAPVLLVCIRVVQGISVAGEYTASGVLVVEEADRKARGLMGSWIAFAMMWGCVLGSGVPALTSTLLTDEQVSAWGWRIPFFIGGAVAFFSSVLRVHLSESSQMKNVAERIKSPIGIAVRNHWRLIVQMIVLLIPTAVIYFLIFVYAASYLSGQMHHSTSQALDISTINLIAIALLGLIAGHLSDRFGRRAVMMVGAIDYGTVGDGPDPSPLHRGFPGLQCLHGGVRGHDTPCRDLSGQSHQR